MDIFRSIICYCSLFIVQMNALKSKNTIHYHTEAVSIRFDTPNLGVWNVASHY